MKFIYFIILFFISYNVLSQSINNQNKNLENYITRMYHDSPFTGVKVIETYDKNYLISIVLLNKNNYSDSSSMNRVAQVKAQSQASNFFNGSEIETEFIVKSNEKRVDNAITVNIETIETIKENSLGFVRGIELLTLFDSIHEESKKVFVFFKEIK